MKDLPTAIERLIELLDNFQNQVHEAPEQLEVQTVMNNIELLDRLKNRLDNAHHVVWVYRLSAEQGSSQNSSYALRLYRMQRIREMMNHLVEQESPQNDLKVQLFVHELERIASRQRPKTSQ